LHEKRRDDSRTARARKSPLHALRENHVVSTDGVTIGIDLAAQARDTAACVVDWGGAPADLGFLGSGLDDEALLELIAAYKPAKVAIDAPFGWPAPFVSAISSYAAGAPWSATDTRPLRLRATDLNVIEQTGQQPLSVSSDRIAVTAMRCAGLLTSVAGEGSELDRAGGGLVVEVYPAAALRRWGFDPRGYKGAKPEQLAKRIQLVEGIATASASWLQLDEHQWALVTASDHLLDALICSLLAQASVLGAVEPIPMELRELARVEGWIHLPQRQPLVEFDPSWA
jgi:predicted nuclease with RNAse H fold